MNSTGAAVTEGEAAIVVDGVTKLFGPLAALREVTFDIAPGELVALLGPSGSGKTTLLRVLAGLEHPDGGRVLIDGADATGLRVQDRQVGFVFQHYALFRHMSVFENIAYGLRARPRRRRPAEADIRRRVGELLDLVQLGGLDARYPGQLSGGQRQRVALARALAIEPRVLLLDEPFGALDAKVRRELRRWIREFHDRTGHTTVFVTHDQDEALELADRVAILHKGRLEQIGVADDIHDNPASPFVTTFVGETASVPVTVKGGRARLEGRDLRVDASHCPDGPACLYVRPPDLAPCDTAEATLIGAISLLRRTGAGRRAEIAVDGAGHVVEVDLPVDTTLRPGDLVGLKATRHWLFPGDAE
ncbi:sulfate/molybdate ABC transporter ATP-binding protein [Alsobacter sp. SYSU M60028]|uniref:Sulfate/molybdate ABC transporter ATP-binding protein n=1 Tax=Alsobacter ponti TaxID=2962936 RepID=A0ABT1LA72_9HYPH|nr:sulfate/molybdate ABC transporter ATP-binding protein [Alsobacter ponti]MCP8938399.1 sulfate/molybdate ABC transporter ATP-binding protein [Alsobacter ponti]